MKLTIADVNAPWDPRILKSACNKCTSTLSPTDKGVYPVLTHGRYAVVGGPSVNPVLLHASVGLQSVLPSVATPRGVRCGVKRLQALSGDGV